MINVLDSEAFLKLAIGVVMLGGAGGGLMGFIDGRGFVETVLGSVMGTVIGLMVSSLSIVIVTLFVYGAAFIIS